MAWRMTSDQAPVFWPFISAPALPPTGAQMGIDQLSGGSFYCDPFGWVLRDDVPVTNPNIFQFAKPGTGKSGTTKAFCNRMMPFGYRTLVLGDPKDEYESLCRAHGVEPFVIGPGLPTRINPLAMGPLGHGWEKLSAEEAQRRATIIFGRWLDPGPRARRQHEDRRPTTRAVRARREPTSSATPCRSSPATPPANTTLRETTIPQLWDLLRNPTEDLVKACEYGTRRQFLDETRLLRNALGELVTGTLAGLFDDLTNIEVDWRAPIQSFSLSRLDGLGDEAVGHRAAVHELVGPRAARDRRARRPAHRRARRGLEADAARRRRSHELRRRPAALRAAWPARAATSSSPTSTSPPTCSRSVTPTPRPP